MHPVVELLHYIQYNLILSCIITGGWAPAPDLLLVPPNVTTMPSNLGTFPAEFKSETDVTSQCPNFYAEDTLILSQAIYLGLLWLFMVANHILHMDLGGYSPPHGDLFLLFVNFCHTAHLFNIEWTPKEYLEWGPFEKISTEAVNMWGEAGFTSTIMRYQESQQVDTQEALELAKLGVDTSNHSMISYLNMGRLAPEDWAKWKEAGFQFLTTANWVVFGFNVEAAVE
ncbi:hypothetical protein DSO57_1025152 [Entomophthora muscae]|uniref:Uncharacterized protein n=1 Tax=Entomophthora muscae TaxID=34485 RepID=A0ACC2TPF7_9FUNG|nr:hypothetical protein DSO57_1025152 [Entomophthora muscae]